MSEAERKRIISEIEEKRNSKVIVYFCGDRPLTPLNILGNAIRPLYDHVLDIVGEGEKCKHIDLFLYSRGGRLEIPWSIVTMMREFCDKFEVLIPFRCHSAATMIAMGADNIIMGRKGELGPIDPSLELISPNKKLDLPSRIGTEDVSSYVTFIRERAGLTDQQAIFPLINCLAEKVNPIVLGQIQRTYSHIRLVAGKLLTLRKPVLPEKAITSIIETLTEKIFLHGHAIGYEEAKEIGLQVKKADKETERLMWELYLNYEQHLKLNLSGDPFGYFLDDTSDNYEEADITIGMIESVNKLHRYIGTLRMTRQRNVPPNPQININLNLQLPPNIQAQQLPQNIQQALQNMLQQAAANAEQLVYEEIKRQSPVIGANVRMIGGKWEEP